MVNSILMLLGSSSIIIALIMMYGFWFNDIFEGEADGDARSGGAAICCQQIFDADEYGCYMRFVDHFHAAGGKGHSPRLVFDGDKAFELPGFRPAHAVVFYGAYQV